MSLTCFTFPTSAEACGNKQRYQKTDKIIGEHSNKHRIWCGNKHQSGILIQYMIRLIKVSSFFNSMEQSPSWEIYNTFSCSRNSSSLTETEDTLPCTQELAPSLNLMNPIRTLQTYVPMIHCNINLPSTSRLSKQSPSLRLSNQNCVRLSHLPYALCTAHSTQSDWICHLNI